MTTLHRAWQPDERAAPRALRRPGRPWALAALHAPLWIAALGALCVLALLLVFRQVVQRGVQQSESRHRASAAHADAVWRCNALRGAGPRAACRAQLDATRAVAAMPTDAGDTARR